MTLSIQQIIEAANQAGLCFPRCWDIEEPTPKDLEMNERWVHAMDTTPEQQEIRQQILDAAAAQREKRISQLMEFARLLRELPSQ